MAKKTSNNSALVTLFFATSTIVAVFGILSGSQIYSCLSENRGGFFACTKSAVKDFDIQAILPISKLKPNLTEEVEKFVEPVIIEPVEIEDAPTPVELVIIPAPELLEPSLPELVLLEQTQIAPKELELPIDENTQEIDENIETIIIPKTTILEEEIIALDKPLEAVELAVAPQIEDIPITKQEVDLPIIASEVELIDIVEENKLAEEVSAIDNSSIIASKKIDLENIKIIDDEKIIPSSTIIASPIGSEENKNEATILEPAVDEIRVSDIVEIFPNPVLPYLSIDEIKIDEERNFFAGRGENDLIVQLFIDDRLVGTSTIKDEHWQINLDEELLALPNQKVRIDFLKPEQQNIFARADIDFINGNIELEAKTLEECCPTNNIIVQQGDTLWELSKRFYGSGYRYKLILEANDGLINNPRWIYPGQILEMPVQ